MYWIRSPFLLQKYYSKLIWKKPNEDQSIYLTFDDGPIPEITPFVLDLLQKHQIKATFFCIGDNIQKHPEIFERIKNEGHHIGNHTFNHLKGWKTDDETYIKNIQKCQELTQTNLFRPPYGRIKKSQIQRIQNQFDIIMWTVLSGDFDPKLSPEKCLQNVIQNTKSGDIVVFHDSIKAQACMTYTLPLAIDYWLKEGFTFKTL